MENEYPSLPEQGKNLAKFTFEILKRAVANGGASLIVSDEVQRERLSVCKKCPKYDELQHRCKECGCPLGSKVKFALDSCPLKKWKESDSDWINEEYENIFNNLNKEIPKNIPPEPHFPDIEENNIKIGDRYTWNYKNWEWDGKKWVKL